MQVYCRGLLRSHAWPEYLELGDRSADDLVGVKFGADQRNLVARDRIGIRVPLGSARNWVKTAFSLLQKVCQY